MQYFRYFTLIILLHSAIASCENNCAGCVKCTYLNITTDATVTQIDTLEDNTLKVSIDTSFSLGQSYFYSDELDSILIDRIQLEATLIIYGKAIQTGSCQPFMLDSIKMKK